MEPRAATNPQLLCFDDIHVTPTAQSPNKFSKFAQSTSQEYDDDVEQCDLLARAKQAEARAGKLEFELQRAQKSLAEAQQRQRDTNQLLRRLGDANASLRADLERERSKSIACTASSNSCGSDDNRRVREESGDGDENVIHPNLDQLRDSTISQLEAQLTSEVENAEMWKSRCHALEEMNIPTAIAAATTSGLGTQAQLARAEVENLRHRIWTMERELQEKKQLLASGQAESSKWHERCLEAEAKLARSQTGSLTNDPFVLQELTSMQGEVARSALALEEATMAGRGWEANTAAAVAAAGRLERQEGVLEIQLSMTQQRLENVEERLASAPSSVQLTLVHEELRAARSDEESCRLKLEELRTELQACEKALRSADFELELERRSQPAACVKAERATQAAEKNLEALRLAMQAEESLRLEVSKALSDTQRDARSMQIALHNEERAFADTQRDARSMQIALHNEERAFADTERDARSMQIALHNEECALVRCSGDLVTEMSVASKIQDEYLQAKKEATQASANVSAMQNLLLEHSAATKDLESHAEVEAERWKAACHAREKSLEHALAELAEVRAEDAAADSHSEDDKLMATSHFVETLNVEALTAAQSSSGTYVSELVAQLHETQEECRQFESCLQEEDAQRSAAIAHAAQLTQQLVSHGANKKESSCETFVTRQTRNEVRITHLVSEIDDLQAAENSSREAESQAVAKLATLESEVESLGRLTPEIEDMAAEVVSLRRTELKLNEVASVASGRMVELEDMAAEVASLRRTELELNEAASMTSGRMAVLLTEVASLNDVSHKCRSAEVEEHQALMRSAELAVEIDSLRSLHEIAEDNASAELEEVELLRCSHEEALRSSKSADAVLIGLESECAQKVQASVMSRTAMLNELHQAQASHAKLEHHECLAAEQVVKLRTELTSLHAARDEAELAEQRAETQMAELMVEVASLRHLHDHAVHHGKSATLALQRVEDLENESALNLLSSAANRTELFSQVQHYRDMCRQLENAEQQYSWHLQTCEQNLSVEVARSEDLNAKCAENTAKCAMEANRANDCALRCDALEEEEQSLVAQLEDRERYWNMEMAGSMAAADAWHDEQCEMQEALFARHFAEAEALMGGVASDARQEAANWCSALRIAKEDLGRWRNRVQEMHAERMHMESALEAHNLARQHLARARNTWRAKAETAECQLRKSVDIANSKAELLVHENHMETQTELAGAQRQLNELQAKSQESIQREKEKLASVEHARDSSQQQVECLREELKSTEASVARHTLLSAETLERARTDTLTISSEVGAWRTSLSEATAKSDSLTRHSEDLERECTALRTQLGTQAEEVSEVKARLQKAEHRFNAAESGTDFLHKELSRTRKRSEHVMEALAVEQSDASVLRCRIRELETQLIECSGSYACKALEDEHVLNQSDKDFTPVTKDSKRQNGSWVSVELGTLRKELRDSRGGEPLSDMTGAWQRVQALENCPPSAKQDISATLEATPQSPVRNITRNRGSGNTRRENSASLNSLRSPPPRRPEHSPPSGASGRSSPKSLLLRPSADEEDPLVVSISSSSSSVATRLSACFSPAIWPKMGTRECSRSPEASEVLDMGLEAFGTKSLECSFGAKPRNILALPASPSPSKCRETLGVAEFGSSGTRGLRF